MPHTKSPRSSKKVKSVSQDSADDSGRVAVVPISKIKNIPDVDLHDDVIGIVDEKPEVDPLHAEEESDDLASEESLDDEEINPFGDKWEV
jgi:hypothetical protein